MKLVQGRFQLLAGDVSLLQFFDLCLLKRRKELDQLLVGLLIFFSCFYFLEKILLAPREVTLHEFLLALDLLLKLFYHAFVGELFCLSSWKSDIHETITGADELTDFYVDLGHNPFGSGVDVIEDAVLFENDPDSISTSSSTPK